MSFFLDRLFWGVCKEDDTGERDRGTLLIRLIPPCVRSYHFVLLLGVANTILAAKLVEKLVFII